MTKTQRWLLVAAAFMVGVAVFIYSISAIIVKLDGHFASKVVMQRFL